MKFGDNEFGYHLSHERKTVCWLFVVANVRGDTTEVRLQVGKWLVLLEFLATKLALAVKSWVLDKKSRNRRVGPEWHGDFDLYGLGRRGDFVGRDADVEFGDTNRVKNAFDGVLDLGIGGTGNDADPGRFVGRTFGGVQ